MTLVFEINTFCQNLLTQSKIEKKYFSEIRLLMILQKWHRTTIKGGWSEIWAPVHWGPEKHVDGLLVSPGKAYKLQTI